MQQKELLFCKRKSLELERGQQLNTMYINKVQPIRQFSSMVNMMHAVLNNKEELDNLNIYENYCLKQLFEVN